MNRLNPPSDDAAIELLQVAWDDGPHAMWRGRRRTDSGAYEPVLVLRPSGAYPRAEIMDRLSHEYGLANILERAGALRPLQLVRMDGEAMLVLEEWDGQPLDAFPMPFDQVVFLRLAVAIASALGKVHASGLIHRNLNPSHILVSGSGSAVRLTGFGIASSLQRERQSPEAPELIAGTLAYMAPEQTGRMNRSIDLRSDLYSLGVVFYRMLTGQLPFKATDPMELVHCHIARQALPPRSLVPTLAPAISALVMKLLEKTAEDRYQTASGVVHDLRRCLAQFDSNGDFGDFALGQYDISDRLLIPEKLYGRSAELGILLGTFERVVNGESGGLVLVTGYSGVGKSAVVNELHKVLVPRAGFFLAGKFDQYTRDIPYATLAMAFQAGVRSLLAKSESELAGWRHAFLEALGGNGRLVVELVPELATVIGDQPPVAVLSPQDAQRRFHLVFCRFISVFARADHPLALFLDDLQWLDSATLDFLEDLFVQGGLPHLLVVGAYRNNEVDAAHPLMRTLETIRASDVPVQEIVLAPLASEHLESLVCDALHCPLSKAVPLARMLHQKTGGNPFFVLQFFSSLADEGLLKFDHAAGRWSWDISRIHAKGYTENVVELMLGRLGRLPAETQVALQRFACIGNASTFALLETICEMPPESLREALSHAVRAGLVLGTGQSYRFLHDRVQEAAYALVPESARPEMHLRIARLLLSKTPLEQRDEAVFDIVGQFNRATHLIVQRSEREQVAQLNLIAGKRAKFSAAYTSALAYLTAGRSLLSDDDWTSNYDLIFPLESLLAECELLNGKTALAEARLADLDRRARKNQHVAIVTRLRITLYTTLDRSERAVDIGLDYLRRGGTDWPAHPDLQAVQAEYSRTGALLGERQIEDLIGLPLLNDPDVQDVLDVLTEIVTPAFFTDPNLCALVLCRMVNLSLEHGNCDASCYAYVWFATYAGPLFDQYEVGYRFGRLGYALVEHHRLTRFKARTYTSFGNIVIPWARHVLEGREPIRRAFEIANQTGDLTYSLYTCCDLIQNFMSAGDALGDVEIEVERAVAIADRVRFGLVSDMLRTYRGLVRTLRGSTPRFGSFDDAQFDEAEFELHLSSSSTLALPAFDYWARKLQARYLASEFAEALDAKAKAASLLWVATSQFETAEYHFYGALSHAACWNDAGADERQSHREALLLHRRQLDIWASHCPENFENRAALVSAEIARIEGDIAEAERLYDLAIRSSRMNGFVHNEGIACEAAARYYAGRELTEIAEMYRANARHAFLRWGAKGKVRQMDDLFPQLSRQGEGQVAGSSIDASVEHLDLATVLKVSQAISREIVLDDLVRTLMRTAIEHAGAERGVLIAGNDTGLWIEAEAATVAGLLTVSLERGTVLQADRMPVSLIQYVHRTGENVILNGSSQRNEFRDDPYLRKHRMSSLACMPLLLQDKPIALLYLENSLASHVFTASRVAVLKLLASQAAIALENSRLYRDLAEREARIRRLVDANIVGVFIWDLRGPIYEANDAFLRIIGYSRADLAAGRVNCMQLTPEEWHDQDVQAIAELRRTGVVQPFEKEYIRADGSRVAVLLGAALFGSAEDQIVAFVVDLTERKQAEANARENERRFHEIEIELTHANRIATLGQLTASISHEIRQPVASAVFNAQAATHWLDAQPPNLEEVRAALARVVNNGTRANDVIRRIRALVKKTPARRERLVVNEVIREVIELARSEASKHQVSIGTDFQMSLPDIQGDRVQLQQVIMNLMVNAMEAMDTSPQNERKLKIATALQGEDQIRITISDTGPGIAAADIARLFEPFYTTKAMGMGMGLSICRSIVESHGGTLRVFSNEPHGAVFQFELNIREGDG
ncbi:PAS domain S-box-containing protein [Paraburkholderia sp. GAS199]|uniref:trifunctional serine/threonine-protein kinase/ATP-binding protein/sensor histidine kinase n=1 Tax=Paraburkholderia sp. GAS199 TaxID=3035126 RepID=UPI003D1F52A6